MGEGKDYVRRWQVSHTPLQGPSQSGSTRLDGVDTLRTLLRRRGCGVAESRRLLPDCTGGSHCAKGQIPMSRHLGTSDASRAFLFLGSGVSLPAPSGLPLFPHIREALLDGLQVTQISSRNMPCETLLHLVDDSGWPVIPLLRGLFRNARPNAVHVASAELVARGGIVWTPNADELIEEAGGPPAHAERLAGLTNVTPEAAGRLVKPHGTISAPKTLAFKAPQVLAAAPPSLVRRLDRDIFGRHVSVCGYSALDPDLALPLVRALEGAASIRWFELDTRTQELRDRLGRLGAGDGVVDSVMGTKVPAQALLDSLDPFGVTHTVTADLRKTLARVDVPRIDARGLADQHLAAGRVLAQLGQLDESAERYRCGSRRGTLRQRVRSRLLLLADAMYRPEGNNNDPWGPTAREALDKVCAVPGLGVLPWGASLLSMRAGLLEQEGDYLAAFRVAGRTLRGRPGPRRLLDAAAPARKSGRLTHAVDWAQRAVEETHAEGAEGEIRCRALFELCYGLRWMGRLEEASRTLDHYDQVAVYGGANWGAWALFERGCLMGLLAALGEAGTDPAEAVVLLERCAQQFDAAGQPHKKLQARSAEIGTLRMAEGVDQAENLWLRVWEERQAQRRRSIFEEEGLLLERAQLSRERGHWAEATAAASAVLTSGCAVHVVLALLGVARAAAEDQDIVLDNSRAMAWIGCETREHAAPGYWARAALDIAEEAGFGYGIAHANALLASTGEISSAQARDRALVALPLPSSGDLDTLATMPLVFH